METAIRATCETLRGVDEAIQTIVDGLEERGVLDDTYLVFTSDNGYSFGEHRLVGKGHLYEESIRVPLLVRGPDVEASGVDRLTSNVDLVPTILEWAGVTPPAGFVDGTSFAPTLRGDRPGEPDAVLLYGCRTRRPGGVLASAEDEPVGSAVCGGYVEEMGTAWGVRTATHKLVEYDGGALQLFDLTRDPYELSNLADDPTQVGTVERLSERLAELRGA
jgi:arylsulfatase A-like enzyme